MIGAIVGMTLGAYSPILWGDAEVLGMASLLMAMTGGFIGIWLAVWLSKRLS